MASKNRKVPSSRGARRARARHRGREESLTRLRDERIDARFEEGIATIRADRLDSDALVFMRLLRAVEHGVRRISKGMRSQLGVTGSERLVLRMVGRHPGLSAGELARLLHLNASTLTGTLERLVRRRLLARRVDARDRRKDVLELTAAGERIDRLRAGTVEARFQQALATLARGDVAIASAVLEAVAQELSTRERRRAR